MAYGNNALSVRIAEQLTEMIGQRRFLPGDKLPNELELAEELQIPDLPAVFGADAEGIVLVKIACPAVNRLIDF